MPGQALSILYLTGSTLQKIYPSSTSIPHPPRTGLLLSWYIINMHTHKQIKSSPQPVLLDVKLCHPRTQQTRYIDLCYVAHEKRQTEIVLFNCFSLVFGVFFMVTCLGRPNFYKPRTVGFLQFMDLGRSTYSHLFPIMRNLVVCTNYDTKEAAFVRFYHARDAKKVPHFWQLYTNCRIEQTNNTDRTW